MRQASSHMTHSIRMVLFLGTLQTTVELAHPTQVEKKGLHEQSIGTEIY